MKSLQLMFFGLVVTLAGTAQAQKIPLANLRLPVAKAAAPVCTDEIGRRLAGVLGLGAPPPANSLTVNNKTGSNITMYLGFLANSCYQPSDFSSFCTVGSNQYICTFPLDNGASQVLNFTKNTCEASFALAVNQDPWQGCSNSFAEFTLHDYWSFNETYQDTYDVSLVNGFSYPISINPSAGPSATASTANGNQRNIGVYPLSCTTCTGLGDTPCAGNASACKTNQTAYPCQDQQASGANYTVTYNPLP
jgi:hypothetical protein